MQSVLDTTVVILLVGLGFIIGMFVGVSLIIDIIEQRSDSEQREERRTLYYENTRTLV